MYVPMYIHTMYTRGARGIGGMVQPAGEKAGQRGGKVKGALQRG